MGNYIVNLSGNFCELFIVLFFLKDNYKPRIKKQLFIPLCIILTLFQFFNTNLFLAKSTFIVIGSLIFIFFLLFLYEMEWKNRIAYLLFLYAAMALSEMFVVTLLSSLFEVNVDYIQNNIIIFASSTIVSKFLAYFLTLLVKKKTVVYNNIPKIYRVLLFLPLPIASTLIILLFVRCCYQIQDKLFEIITLSASIILVLGNVAIFYIVEKLNELVNTKEKLLFAEKHINKQIVHYQELYKYQNELRIFRHDTRNRLISLIGLIKKEEIQKALQFMESSLEWINLKTNNIVNSGNPVVDAILQDKLHTAKDKGIKIDLFVKLSSNINIDELELGIILGNTLDNAIEAVEKISSLNSKEIEFKLITVADRISISVKNPVEFDVNTENLITSKQNKMIHGYGIRSIQAIANKYDGIVLFSCENRVFSANINLGNRSLN